MGQFKVTGECAPGFQLDGNLYKPGEVVTINIDPDDKTEAWRGKLPHSTDDDDKPVYDKLEPLDAEAAAMSGWSKDKIAKVFPPQPKDVKAPAKP